MQLKKILPLMFFTLFIQSSNQQALAMTELLEPANIVSYGIGIVAGGVTGGIVIRLLEQNDAQQQKEAQEPVIVENDNSDLVTIDNTENKDNNHHIRNLIIGAACGIVVGVITYKISHDVIMPHFITPKAPDQKINSLKIWLFIKDEKGGEAREVEVPKEFMLNNSLENLNNFLKWAKEKYPDSYSRQYVSESIKATDSDNSFTAEDFTRSDF
jgi:hypothetical protein